MLNAETYVLPFFVWSNRNRYGVDHAGGKFALLSIEPMG